MAHLGVGAYLRDVDEPGGGPYGAFVDEFRSHDEYPILAATVGELRYDKRDGRYLAGSPEKMLQPNLPGTLISLKAGECAVMGSGPVQLPVDLRYGHPALGRVRQGLSHGNGHGGFELTAGLDFPLMMPSGRRSRNESKRGQRPFRSTSPRPRSSPRSASGLGWKGPMR